VFLGGGDLGEKPTHYSERRDPHTNQEGWERPTTGKRFPYTPCFNLEDGEERKTLSLKIELKNMPLTNMGGNMRAPTRWTLVRRRKRNPTY